MSSTEKDTPSAGTKRINVRMEETLYDALREAAFDNRRSFNEEVVLRLIESLPISALVEYADGRPKGREEKPFILSDRFEEMEEAIAALTENMEVLLRKLDKK